MESFYENLLRELECPVCHEYMLPPIYLCVNGHPLCDICRKKLITCPQGSCNLGTVRCLQLENISSFTPLPCKYINEGCEVKILTTEKQSHESECIFAPIVCKSCSTVVTAGELEVHWEQYHSPIIEQDYVINTVSKQINACSVKLIKVHNTRFWLVCQLRNSIVSWFVATIDKSVAPQDFYYEIEISKQNSKMKIILVNECASTTTDEQGNCSFITSHYLHNFGGDDLISFCLSIKKNIRNAN